MAMPSLSLAASHNATRISDGSVEPVEVDQLNAAPFNLAHEAWLLFYIAMPAIVVHLSLLFVFPQTASAVGLTLGTKELAGSSLGSLAGNLTILSVITGALTAADTLMPRAFGSGMYRQVGQLAVQGFVVCTLLLIPPILPLCTMMEWAFKRLGQDADASMLASEWIRIYLVGLPAILLLRVTQSFLNAQHVVLPLAFGCTIGSFLIHPILLKTIVPALGFWGSGLCVTITQFAMVSLVFLYLWIRPEHKPETWPGLSRAFVREALRPGPLLRYTKLSLGGVLSLSVCRSISI
jgi:Na+-driven multidrug efflux pump